MNIRQVHLSPRLSAAMDMLRGANTVADIGCDHGRLAAALLQQHCCEHVIATDISEPSLEKAERLIRYIGLSDRVSFRCGDGLTVLKPNECDAIAMLGMGGTLMAELLSASPEINTRLVLQPMRAQADIREYLYLHNYRITDDRVVIDHGRLYQVFSAEATKERQPWPEGFPKGFFDVGFQSFVEKDPNLCELCRFQIEQHNRQMKRAVGTAGERILGERIASLQQIIDALSEVQA